LYLECVEKHVSSARVPLTETRDGYATGDAPWDSGESSKEVRRVSSEHNIASCRALELGCGTGTNAVHLPRANSR